MKQFTTLRVLALALVTTLIFAGDGGDTNCDGSGDTQCPDTQSPDTQCPDTQCPDTQSPDTQGTENCMTQDTQCTEGCATQDTQACDQTCSYQGPQVNGGFWDGPTGSDSNPCCIEYRVGPFVYVDPIWDPIPLTSGGGGYVPPTPAMPYRSHASGSAAGYMPPTGASAQPTWDEQEWICQHIGKNGSPCGFPNSMQYNPIMCGVCEALRPVAPVAETPPMPSNVDPLSIQSPATWGPGQGGADRTGKCCVCMDRINDVVLLGAKDNKGQYKCRHQCMCRQCAAQMRGLDQAHRRCPMCREKTQYFVVADKVPAGFRTYQD